MALRATRDTYGYELVGPDAEIRRQYFAGQPVPDHIRLEDEGAVEEVGGGGGMVGLGAAPHRYAHQADDVEGQTPAGGGRLGIEGTVAGAVEKQREERRSRRGSAKAEVASDAPDAPEAEA